MNPTDARIDTRNLYRKDRAMTFRTPCSVFAVVLLAATGCTDGEFPTGAAPARPAFDHVPDHLVVNSLANPGTGGCTPDECTLHEAIGAAISSGAPTTITFDIPGCTTASRCTIELAQFVIGGGTQVTIDGAHSIILSGNGNRLFILFESAVTFRNLVITKGGGADGGAIFSQQSTVTIESSTLTDNHGNSRGGVIYNVAGSLTVINSTFSNNTARFDDAHAGGAIYNAGGTLTVVNSTITGNTGVLYGGGIYSGSAAATIINSTITNNAAWWGGGLAVTGEVTVINSIIAGNTARLGGADCSAPFDNGTITSGGYNLTGQDTGCDLTGTGDRTVPSDAVFTSVLDPALSYNGGPTATQSLLPGSPALDAIPVGTNGCGLELMTDQRGETRPQGRACDIGAFELTVPDAWPIFGGFLPPLNPDQLNEVKAGRAVPVKFSLGGYFGLDIFAAGYPASAAIDCPGDDASVSAVTSTLSAGESSLSYDAEHDQYLYVWSTDRNWAGTCRRFAVMFEGQTEAHTVDIRFVR